MMCSDVDAVGARNTHGRLPALQWQLLTGRWESWPKRRAQEAYVFTVSRARCGALIAGSYSVTDASSLPAISHCHGLGGGLDWERAATGCAMGLALYDRSYSF